MSRAKTHPPPSQGAPAVVLDAVLRVMAPLVRLLIRHGVTYPGFAAALKRVFLDAARTELESKRMAITDSAVTLLCGVHRRDVRNLTRAEEPPAPPGPAGLVAQVVARWLSETDYLDRRGRPKRLVRGHASGEFDTLAASVSRDVRPRALLDELLRLNVARESDAGIELLAGGFAPREGLAETAWLFADNLADHAAAAARNLGGETNFLEQSIFVDELTADSVRRLQAVSKQAWNQAFKRVMREAQVRFDHDAREADVASRTQRARFGVYFYSEGKEGSS